MCRLGHVLIKYSSCSSLRCVCSVLCGFQAAVSVVSTCKMHVFRDNFFSCDRLVLTDQLSSYTSHSRIFVQIHTFHSRTNPCSLFAPVQKCAFVLFKVEFAQAPCAPLRDPSIRRLPPPPPPMLHLLLRELQCTGLGGGESES